MNRETLSSGYDSGLYQDGRFNIAKYLQIESDLKKLPRQKPPSVGDRYHKHPEPESPMTKTSPKPPGLPEPPKPGERKVSSGPVETVDPGYGFKIVKLKSDQWIFTQVTALASCIISGYYVDPKTIKYANNNYNCWSNEILYKYYPTFIGAQNYYNHEQDPRKSYGFIAGATIRKIQLKEAENPETDFVYYVDLLVATNKIVPPNPRVIQRMLTGELKTWSMGCDSSSLQCTKCGMLSENPEDDCVHMKYELGRRFITPLGQEAKVLAIVTPNRPSGKKGIVKFKEISMVEGPAFKGAVSGFLLDIPPGQDVFFKIPASAWNRKKTDHNGVVCWKDRGYVEVVR